MCVAIIDYKLGNLHSVKSACDYVKLPSVITDDPEVILKSKAVILPGVGAFKEGMKYLQNSKLDLTIKKFIKTKKPFLGICLGMQLLFDHSEEFGHHPGLGVIKGKIVKFDFNLDKNYNYPIPQIGWNKIYLENRKWKNTILEKNNNEDFMYFVHSYYAIPEDDCILSKTRYGGIEFCSSIQFENIFATQFHPEKSGKKGLNIYKYFKKICKL
jgi:imidazole glycerol-phosphate synthase subunit HisH